MDWKDVAAPSNVQEIIDAYESKHDDLTKQLKDLDPAKWDNEVVMFYNGQEMMRSNGYDMAWGFLLDLIHHRGQLSTYLRPMGAKVPSIYGPSADEEG